MNRARLTLPAITQDKTDYCYTRCMRAARESHPLHPQPRSVSSVVRQRSDPRCFGARRCAKPRRRGLVQFHSVPTAPGVRQRRSRQECPASAARGSRDDRHDVIATRPGRTHAIVAADPTGNARSMTEVRIAEKSLRHPEEGFPPIWLPSPPLEIHRTAATAASRVGELVS